jgi:hypothetical protein
MSGVSVASVPIRGAQPPVSSLGSSLSLMQEETIKANMAVERR